jgi:DNA repair protein RadC
MEQYELEEIYDGNVIVRDCGTVYSQMCDIKHWEKEVFVAFFLDSRNRIISREIVSIGTINTAVTHPREIFRTAIIRNANSVIVAHNHPGGSLEPSEEDREVTRKLKEAGEVLGIKLLDHVIVTMGGYYSFKQENEI